MDSRTLGRLLLSLVFAAVASAQSGGGVYPPATGSTSDATVVRNNTSSPQALAGPLTAPKVNGVWHVTAPSQDIYPIWQSALAAITANSAAQTIIIDPGVAAVASAPLINNSTTCINIIGAGSGQRGPYAYPGNPHLIQSSITYTGTTTAGGVFVRDAGATGVLAGCTFQGFTVDGNNTTLGSSAAYGFDVSTMQESKFVDLQCQAATGECFRFGMNGTMFENHFEHLLAAGSGPAQFAFGTVATSAGAVTGTTISQAGSGYHNPVVLMWGSRGSGFGSGNCTTLGPFSSYVAGVQPKGVPVMTAGNGIASITMTNNGSSCNTGVQMQIADLAPGTYDQWGNTVALGSPNSAAAYGYHFGPHFTDNDLYELIDAEYGILGAVRVEGGDNRFYGTHFYMMPEGIVSNGNNIFHGTECDSVYRNCFVETGSGDQITDTQIYYNTAAGYGPTSFPGAGLAWITNAASFGIRFSGSSCSATESTWNHISLGINPGFEFPSSIQSTFPNFFGKQNNDFRELADCRGSLGSSFIGDLNNVFGHGFYSFGIAGPQTVTWNGRVNIAPYSTTGDSLDLLLPSASYTGDYLGGWTDSSTSVGSKAFGIDHNANIYTTAAVKAASVQLGVTSGPTWTTGSAAPTGTCANGSLYSQTSTGALYACQATAWVLK